MGICVSCRRRDRKGPVKRAPLPGRPKAAADLLPRRDPPMANAISNIQMANPLKVIVSKRRKRYMKNGFNLDLAYITEKLIAMGFPAEKLEGVYRNHIDEVARFLDLMHDGHYKIYNLCSERSYDTSKFHERVVRYAFDDHTPPKMELIIPFCEDVHSWLTADTRNVAAVHCKAGKGRTGTMVSCYLLYSGQKATADEALQYYGNKRTHDEKGVTIPSQRRYVEYYEALIRSGLTYSATKVHIRELIMSPPPTLNGGQGAIELSVTQAKPPLKAPTGQEVRKHSTHTRFVLTQCTPLSGDVRVDVYTKPKIMMRKEKLFHFWFNTFFVANCVGATRIAPPPDSMNLETFKLTLSKWELDDAHKDKQHKLYAHDFKVELIVQKQPDSSTFCAHSARAPSPPASSSDSSCSEPDTEPDSHWDSGETMSHSNVPQQPQQQQPLCVRHRHKRNSELCTELCRTRIGDNSNDNSNSIVDEMAGDSKVGNSFCEQFASTSLNSNTSVDGSTSIGTSIACKPMCVTEGVRPVQLGYQHLSYTSERQSDSCHVKTRQSQPWYRADSVVKSGQSSGIEKLANVGGFQNTSDSSHARAKPCETFTGRSKSDPTDVDLKYDRAFECRVDRKDKECRSSSLNESEQSSSLCCKGHDSNSPTKTYRDSSKGHRNSPTKGYLNVFEQNNSSKDHAMGLTKGNVKNGQNIDEIQSNSAISKAKSKEESKRDLLKDYFTSKNHKKTSATLVADKDNYTKIRAGEICHPKLGDLKSRSIDDYTTLTVRDCVNPGEPIFTDKDNYTTLRSVKKSSKETYLVCDSAEDNLRVCNATMSSYVESFDPTELGYVRLRNSEDENAKMFAEAVTDASGKEYIRFSEAEKSSDVDIVYRNKISSCPNEECFTIESGPASLPDECFVNQPENSKSKKKRSKRNKEKATEKGKIPKVASDQTITDDTKRKYSFFNRKDEDGKKPRLSLGDVRASWREFREYREKKKKDRDNS